MKCSVYAPNKEYSGVSFGVSFVNGQGETADPWAIEMLAENGYKLWAINEPNDDNTGGQDGNDGGQGLNDQGDGIAQGSGEKNDGEDLGQGNTDENKTAASKENKKAASK